MSLPIHGPIVSSESRVGYYRYQARHVQRRPYDQPAPYTGRIHRRIAWDGSEPSNVAEQWVPYGCANYIKIVAYDRFKNKLGDKAELGVSLIELGKSAEMLRNRLLQLVYVIRALKRGHIDDAWAHLKAPGVLPPRVRPGSENWAHNYLEFHFGWAPAVADIYSAINVLQNGIPPFEVRASAHDISNPSLKAIDAYARSYNFLWSSTQRYGGEVRVTNPNLHLANSLGLTNPATWVYETIRLSFIADWFFNVSQFLSLGTDFLGLELTKTWSTSVNQGVVTFDWNTYGWHSEHYQVAMVRSLGIDQPSFGLRPFKMWGWRRAAAAASLMTILLPKKKRK